MAFADALRNVCIAEWEWFGKDEGRNDKRVIVQTKVNGVLKDVKRRKEAVFPYSDRVYDYWLSIPTKNYDDLVAKFAKSKRRLDGTVNLAWSAAFISYCMQKAGAGDAFPYAPGHATWIVQAIKAKKKNKLDAPLVGYRPGEKTVAVGDLFGKPRNGAGVTYDNAAGWFESHSDVVVEVDRPNRIAYVIGGNAGQSVGRVAIPLTADGKANDPTTGWIVHIKNNITGGFAGAVADAADVNAG